MARRMWLRLLYGDGEAQQLVALDAAQAVTIAQTLEPTAVTSVLEFGISGTTPADDGTLANGTALRLDQVDMASTNPDGRPYRRLFKGVVNRITGVSSPRRVPITGDGPLARLKRCKPSADVKLSGSGKTDVDAKKTILTACGVPYSSGDIHGWGVVLGAVQDVWWRRDEYADRIISELDRVFGTATVEVGEGRVVAFPYSKVPADYGTGLYAGQNVQKTYVRGQPSSRFYENARDRGSTDDICNDVRVEGLSWRDDAGCTRQVWAEAGADHPLLGAGVRVGCDVAPSDFIQREEDAKAIARRTLRERNKPPDTVRLRGANHPDVTVGDLISVTDPVYGITLITPAPYLVTTTRRENDTMSVDGVGGPAGAVGTLTAGVSRCCGTQRADGTCEEIGTDPGAIDLPDPLIPPNPGVDICPFDDLTCGPVIPDPDVPFLPDLPGDLEEDPFLDCTEDGFLTCPDGFDGTCHEATTEDSSCTGLPPASTCQHPGWFRHQWHDTADIPGGWDCLCTAHTRLRESGGAGHAYRVIEGGGVDAFTICDSPDDAESALIASFRVSTVEDPTDAADDLTTTGNVCVRFGYRFCAPGQSITMRLVSIDGDGVEDSFSDHAFTLHSDPGFHIVAGFANEYDIASSVFHLESAVLTGGAPPHVSLGLDYRNNGGYGLGAGLPLNEDGAASVCFEMGGQDPRAIWLTPLGSGYLQHLQYFDTDNPLPGEPTHEEEDPAHAGHRIEFRLESGGETDCTDLECPGPMVYDLTIGHTTCTTNPDYTPPEGPTP